MKEVRGNMNSKEEQKEDGEMGRWSAEAMER
jgi:hypothetical protein